MYYYSLYQQRYLKLSFIPIIIFLVFGPIAALGFGFVEISALYAVVIFLSSESSHLILFHLGYLILGVFLIPLSLRMRNYQRANQSDVIGRFPRRFTLWT